MTRGGTDSSVVGRRTRDVGERALPLLAGLATAALALITIGSRDLWLDEAFSIGATNQLLDSYWRRSGSMALYYTLLAPWKEVSLDPGFLRVPSMVFAAAGVGVTVHLALVWFGRRAALWAALVLVPMWGVTRYAQEVRAFSLVMLLTAVSWHLLFGLERSSNRRRWITWGAVSAAAVYSHPLAGLAIVTQYLAIRLAPPTADRDLLKESIPGWATFAVLLVPMGVTFLQPGGVAPDWVPELSRWTISDTLTMVAGPWGWGQAVLAAVLVAATVSAAVERTDTLGTWRCRSLALWAFAPVILLALVSLGEPMLVGRYLIGSLPATALLIATALARLEIRRSLFVGLVVVGIVIVGQVLLHRSDGHPWSEAIAVIEQAAVSPLSHGVVFVAPDIRVPFEVNAHGRPVLQHTVPVGPAEPWRSNRRYFADVDSTQSSSTIAGLTTIWIVDQNLGSPEEAMYTLRLRRYVEDLGFCHVESRSFSDGIEVIRLDRCPEP